MYTKIKNFDSQVIVGEYFITKLKVWRLLAGIFDVGFQEIFEIDVGEGHIFFIQTMFDKIDHNFSSNRPHFNKSVFPGLKIKFIYVYCLT